MAKYDWEAIEKEYRAGIKSACQIENEYGTSRGAVTRKAKREGWTRNLSEDVRQEARARLVSDAVSTDNASDSEVISEAADEAANVVRTHRKDIADLRSLEAELKAELRDDIELRRNIKAGAIGEERVLQMEAAGIKVPQLQHCSGVYRDLSQAMAKRIPLERQAYSLDEKDTGQHDQISDLLAEIDGKTKGLPDT